MYHDITSDTAMTATEHKSDFKLKTDTPYLALMGELWGVYYEQFEENSPRYNGPPTVVSWAPVMLCW